MYVFDYGAPVGWRLAAANPEKIAAIITQNGNAYGEGLSDGWNPIRAYWNDPSEENRNALKMMADPATTKWQYTHGVEDESLVAPESYTLDQYLLDRPGNIDIQLDLFKDYANNVAGYPAFQAYFRTKQPPLLAVWGGQGSLFPASGGRGVQAGHSRRYGEIFPYRAFCPGDPRPGDRSRNKRFFVENILVRGNSTLGQVI
jgi:pimeloyl-ACP methyl ester carboxylesterase